MKTKSKLLLALSALTVGTVAAGATGTYAWFTASRTATLTYSNITAANTRGSLQIKYTALTNSPALSNDASGTGDLTPSAELAKYSNSIKVATATKITDVSSKDGSIFYSPIWGTGDTPVSYATTTSGYIVFSIELKNAGDGAVDAYLDKGSTSITGTNELARWTRVAINAQTSESTPTEFGANDITSAYGHLVFMNNDKSVDPDADLTTYVNGTGASSISNYDSEVGSEPSKDDKFYETVTSIPSMPATSDIGDPTQYVCYLGEIQAGHSIFVNVAIWMEGSIVNDQNAAVGDSIDVKLGFGALDADAGA